MAKMRTKFSCTECGGSFSKWMGRCPQCEAWDTLVEETAAEPDGRASRGRLGGGGACAITEIDPDSTTRLATGESEFDRILGGGLVPGSAVLVGGDPGIGKSTLLLQTARMVAESSGRPVLYVTAEESAQQIRLRAERLGALSETLLVLAENNVSEILPEAEKLRPGLLIIDSIQMVYWPEMQSAPGSIGQVRECAAGLVAQAKRNGVPLFLVGHVTKDGAIAGPKVLEHMVDVVLYFEGDRHHYARLLRGVKNRFGAAGEIGVFEMGDRGLLPVDDPSRLFLSGRREAGSGSAVTASMEGTRPFLVEVQALAAPGAPGAAKRRISGADATRVSMLVAVLEKRCDLELWDKDIFVNIVGGVRLDEPAADLATAMAIASSLRERPVPAEWVILGEVGLGGEVRPVSAIEARLREAARLGFRGAILPDENRRSLGAAPLELAPVRVLAEAMALLESAKPNPDR